MVTSQDRRISVPKEPQSSVPTSGFYGLLSTYLYAPLSGTPTSLIP